MNNNSTVKNRIGTSFGILFSIVMGFVLSEHVKNVVQLMELKAKFPKVMLSFSIFIFLLLSAFETFLHFDYRVRGIESKNILLKMVAYLTWFAQFLPFYAMTYILTAENKNEVTQCQTVASSFAFVYTFYAISCAMDMLISIRQGENKQKNFIRHVLIYIAFAVAYWVFYALIGHIIKEHVFVSLSIFIILILVMYVYDWRDFYIETMFERTH